MISYFCPRQKEKLIPTNAWLERRSHRPVKTKDAHARAFVWMDKGAGRVSWRKEKQHITHSCEPKMFGLSLFVFTPGVCTPPNPTTEEKQNYSPNYLSFSLKHSTKQTLTNTRIYPLLRKHTHILYPYKHLQSTER
jgi:hypothetical protein